MPDQRSRQPTKRRLLEAGVRLFAEKGFRETTVGEIEAAAGLEPRRGAMYRHYASKEALLEAALQDHIDTLSDPALAFGADHAGTRHDWIVLGQWLLAEVDRERAIVRILEQDGDRLPALRTRFRQSLVDPAYAMLTGFLQPRTGSPGAAKGLAAVLLGALVNYRRSVWTFDAVPAGMTEDRFLDAWASMCLLADSSSPSGQPRRPRSGRRS